MTWTVRSPFPLGMTNELKDVMNDRCSRNDWTDTFSFCYSRKLVLAFRRGPAVIRRQRCRGRACCERSSLARWWSWTKQAEWCCLATTACTSYGLRMKLSCDILACRLWNGRPEWINLIPRNVYLQDIQKATWGSATSRHLIVYLTHGSTLQRNDVGIVNMSWTSLKSE